MPLTSDIFRQSWLYYRLHRFGVWQNVRQKYGSQNAFIITNDWMLKASLLVSKKIKSSRYILFSEDKIHFLRQSAWKTTRIHRTCPVVTHFYRTKCPKYVKRILFSSHSSTGISSLWNFFLKNSAQDNINVRGKELY